MATIAVIGAGLAGLVVSRELAHAHDVVVFEKSRGVGGRMATRYADPFEVDHGAQFFAARTNAFRTFLDPLVSAGVIADWPALFAELQRERIVASRQWDNEYAHYLGVPGMNAVGKKLASGLDIRLGAVVRSLQRNGIRWRLMDDRRKLLGEFDWVIVTAPASQAVDLLASSSIAATAANVRMHACYALDAEQRLAACGDWFVRGRVEGAFSSAKALAERVGREAG
ncbi:MAG: FAD-dependent oxidoreductase [Gammaproteobacteria bacterium]|jgi:predicted NAD/FAD-dependent oxidoreductase|nr:FAD-dependent oxidoreductase [Gammaproteobacteria bacterium]MDH3904223.1 FAD-dependent oxidoreductase [Gammaproteobacteria bacterium]